MKKTNLLMLLLLIILTTNVFAQEIYYSYDSDNDLRKSETNLALLTDIITTSTDTIQDIVLGNDGITLYVHRGTYLEKYSLANNQRTAVSNVLSLNAGSQLIIDETDTFLYVGCDTNDVCKINADDLTLNLSGQVTASAWTTTFLTLLNESLFVTFNSNTDGRIYKMNPNTMTYVSRSDVIASSPYPFIALSSDDNFLYAFAGYTNTHTCRTYKYYENFTYISNTSLGGFCALNTRRSIYNDGEISYIRLLGASPYKIVKFNVSSMNVLKTSPFITSTYTGGLGVVGSNDDYVYITKTDNYINLLENENLTELTGEQETNSLNNRVITTNLNDIIYTGLTCEYIGTTLYCYNQTGLCFAEESLDYLCENVYLVNDGENVYTYCDIDNLTFCSGTCSNTETTNIYGVDYTDGVCTTSTTCTNDCNIEGLTYSDTSTSYRQCGFYDADVCLDWSSSISCGLGQYSQNGFCIDLNTTSETYFAKTTFSMLPEIIRASTYDLSGNNPFVRLQSSSSFVTLGFNYQAITEDFYIYQNCGFEEITIVNDEDENETTEKITTFSGYENGITETTFDLPNDDTEVFIIGYDNNEDQVYNYKVQRNITYGVCVYDELDNSSLVGCQTEPSTTLKDVTFKVQTISINNFYAKSVMMRLNGVTGYRDLYTGFVMTESDNVYYKNVVNSTENITISLIKITNGEEYLTTWKQEPFLTYVTDVSTAMDRTIGLDVYKNIFASVPTSQVSEYFNEHYQYYVNKNQNIAVYNNLCYYTDVGEYKVRSYFARNLNETGFWNYKEYNVFVDRLGSKVTATSVEGGAFSNMSKQEKFFVSLISLLVIVVGLMVLGFYLDQIKIFSFLATFMAVGFAIFFTIIGFLPVWVFIIMLIMSGLSVMIIIRNVFTGGN